MNIKISTVLQYSTIDLRFLNSSLYELSKFSDEIIIPIYDHFFNGEKEDSDKLKKSIDIIQSYNKANAYIIKWQGLNYSPSYYHNLSRLLGTEESKNDVLFFLDADEIVDADLFNQWMLSDYNKEYTYWMTCYWYFRLPIYQSKKTESAGLLINKKWCNWNLHVKEERQQLFSAVPKLINGDKELILSKYKTPMIHHYSWVRSKEDMIKKVQNWGHKKDKLWVNLVEEEFNREFNGTDFVHGYDYNIVENKFNI